MHLGAMAVVQIYRNEQSLEDYQVSVGGCVKNKDQPTT
jgi:hypothetical protein